MERRLLELNGTGFEGKIGNELEKRIPNSKVIFGKELYSYKLGKPTEIDVILVTEKAIHVIEAKNWVEWIKGDYSDEMWQGKSRARNAMIVISPYRQNFLHIRTLRNSALASGYKLPPITNIICLPDGTQLITECSEVVNFSMLCNKINQLEKELTNKYNLYDVVRLINRLK